MKGVKGKPGRNGETVRGRNGEGEDPRFPDSPIPRFMTFDKEDQYGNDY
jgi:hypothetical protein